MMRKSVLVIILATLMVFSSFAITLSSSHAGSAKINPAMPQIRTGRTEVGNVYIYANGTVSNSSAVKESGTSNTYNLLVNINGTLFVDRNNTILDGNGLTLTGSISQSSQGALYSKYTNNLTIENVVIGPTSYVGINLRYVNNAVIDNVSTVNFTQFAAIMIYASGCVTVENSNLSFNSTNFPYNEASHGIRVDTATSIVLSNNDLSGALTTNVLGKFVRLMFVGNLKAFNNTIVATSPLSFGFVITNGGSEVFQQNYFSNTFTAISDSSTNSIFLLQNTFNNVSEIAVSSTYVTSYTSSGNIFQYVHFPLYFKSVGSISIDRGSFTNTNYALSFNDYGSLAISNTKFIQGSPSFEIQLSYGGTTSFTNDTINMSKTLGAKGILATGVSGLLNLAGDSFNVPQGPAVDVSYTPQVALTGSTIYANEGLLMGSGSVSYATITNDTFNLDHGGAAVSMTSSSSINDLNFSDNTVASQHSLPGNFGITTSSFHSSSNITVSGNSFANVLYPIKLLATSTYHGSDVRIQNNLVVNSTTAIQEGNYSDTEVTGNHLTNVYNTAISLWANGANSTVSNNMIENMPGIGSMSNGIEVNALFGGTVSKNTILNPGSTSQGIYVENSLDVAIYSNLVNRSEVAFNLQTNNNMLLFANTVNTAYQYGIQSIGNYNSSYYSNTVNNANTSLYAANGSKTLVYANTFHDAQANQSNLVFLSLYQYGFDYFFHNNFLNSTTNSTVSYVFRNSLVNMNRSLPVGGNYYSDYKGSGINGIGSTPMNLTGSVKDFYPLVKEWRSPTVTFIESGLSGNTPWSVKLGSTLMSSNGTSIVFPQTNAQYLTAEYSVVNVPGYIASVASGTVRLNSSSSVVTIDFTAVTYGVTFNESGLAHGTSWSVTLNGRTMTSSGSSMTFNVANGTYNYTVGALNRYTAASTSGDVSVNGAGASVAVSYTQKDFALTITQKGLPSGDAWNVTIGGKTYYSTASSLTVQIPAGTYSITVGSSAGYTATLPSANVTMGTSNSTLSVLFSHEVSPRSGSGIGSAILYGAIGVALGTISTMFATGTVIFRKRKGP